MRDVKIALCLTCKVVWSIEWLNWILTPLHHQHKNFCISHIFSRSLVDTIILKFGPLDGGWLYWCLLVRIFFSRFLHSSSKVIFLLLYVLFPFPVNICLVFSLWGLGPKEGALSWTATCVSHVTPVTLLWQILDPNQVILWKSLLWLLPKTVYSFPC